MVAVGGGEWKADAVAICFQPTIGWRRIGGMAMVTEQRAQDGATAEQCWQWQWGDESHDEEASPPGQVETMNAVSERLRENVIEVTDGFRFRDAFVLFFAGDDHEGDRAVVLVQDLVKQRGCRIRGVRSWQPHYESDPGRWSLAVGHRLD